MDQLISFPWMGLRYTRQLKAFLETLGLRVMLPPRISDRTIKLGTRHSPDMICFPYKVTLGNLIEALDNGAQVLLMHDNAGQCRQRHYWKIQELTLRELGYAFEMHPISRRSFFPLLRRLSGRSHLAIYRAYRHHVGEIAGIDADQTRWAGDRLNIGIIGEVYTCFEESINNDVIGKLRELEVNPYNTVTLTEIASTTYSYRLQDIPRTIAGLFRKDYETISAGADAAQYLEQARAYLNGPLGGHAYSNICQLLRMRDRGVDGVIHLLPLSCMPETTIEPIINRICQEKHLPLLRLPIDETNSQANFETRIETFIELIKRKGSRTHEMLARC